MPSPLRKGIEFRGVCFCYPGMDDVPVLRDLSFVVPAGHSVALVGQNGAGKTTLVKVAVSLVRPDIGHDSASMASIFVNTT